MAHLCINCNAPKVRRKDDAFTCEQCGYTWDVAHEQANAAYLASQGRVPAAPTVEPIAEPDDATPPDAPPADAGDEDEPEYGRNPHSNIERS